MKLCRKQLHTFIGLQCQMCKREGKRLYALANQELVAKRSREWRKANPRRASINKINRRIAKSLRTPKWLTKQEKVQIKDFYLNCPEGYHVDHIIPLQGENVSGLHVLANLQYLTIQDNKIKGNKYE